MSTINAAASPLFALEPQRPQGKPKKSTQLVRRQSSISSQQAIKQGRWTKEEHFRFLEALKLFGKEWRKVQQHVSTRTSTQARSHA